MKRKGYSSTTALFLVVLLLSLITLGLPVSSAAPSVSYTTSIEVTVEKPAISGYYREITIIENSGQTLTDYSVKVVLDSSNFDSWDKVQPDGSDIYFLDSSGNPLYYWIESFDKTNKQAVIWVKVPSIPANGQVTIYMCYGGDNPYASYNDPSKVFLFYDDFSTFDTSKWTTFRNAPNVIEAVDNWLHLRVDSCGANTYYGIKAPLPSVSGFKIVMRFEPIGTLDTAVGLAVADADQNILAAIRMHGGNFGKTRENYLDYLGSSTYLGGGGWEWNEVSRYTLRYDGTTLYGRVYRESTGEYVEDSVSVDISGISYIVIFQRAGVSGYSLEGYIDWVYVREFVDPEPSISIGAEVASPTSVTDTATAQITVTPNANATITIPISVDVTGINVTLYDGWSVVNIEDPSGASVSYTTYDVDATYYKVSFDAAATGTYTIHATSKNSVVSVSTDHTYYLRGASASATASLKDPFGSDYSANCIVELLDSAGNVISSASHSATGSLSTSVTLPSTDGEYYVVVKADAPYAGIGISQPIYVSDVSYTVDYPSKVYVGEPFEVTVDAYLTIDNSIRPNAIVNDTSVTLPYTFTLSFNTTGYNRFSLNLRFIYDGIDKSVTFYSDSILTIYPQSISWTGTLDYGYAIIWHSDTGQIEVKPYTADPYIYLINFTGTYLRLYDQYMLVYESNISEGKAKIAINDPPRQATIYYDASNEILTIILESKKSTVEVPALEIPPVPQGPNATSITYPPANTSIVNLLPENLRGYAPYIAVTAALVIGLISTHTAAPVAAIAMIATLLGFSFWGFVSVDTRLIALCILITGLMFAISRKHH